MFPSFLHHLLTHFGNYILIVIWGVLAVFFFHLAKSSGNSGKDINDKINSMERSNVGTTIDQFGHIGFTNPTLVKTVKELGKTLVFLSKGA